jgi:hypothetical protein
MTHFLLFLAISFGAGVISTVAVYLIIMKTIGTKKQKKLLEKKENQNK